MQILNQIKFEYQNNDYYTYMPNSISKDHIHLIADELNQKLIKLTSMSEKEIFIDNWATNFQIMDQKLKQLKQIHSTGGLYQKLNENIVIGNEQKISSISCDSKV